MRLVRQLPQLTSLESFAVHGSCALDAGKRCAVCGLRFLPSMLANVALGAIYALSSIEHRASSIEHRASDPSAWGLPSIRLSRERGPRRGKFN